MNSISSNMNNGCINTSYEKKGVFTKIKDWAKENISGPRDTFVKDYGKSQDMTKIAVAGAGSTVAFAGAAGKEILAGEGIPHDKLLHAGGCFFMTTTLSAMGLPPWLAATSTFTGVSVIKGLIHDGLMGMGNVDIRDGFANLSGSLAGYSVATTLEGKHHPPQPQTQSSP